MSRSLKFATVLVLAGSLSTSTASAAPVSFLGTVDGAANTVFAPGTLVSLALDLTPGAGLTAAISTASLKIGSENWNVLIGGINDVATIVPNGAATDNLDMQAFFSPSSPSGIGGAGLSLLQLTIFGVDDLGVAPTASEGKIELLAKGDNVATGSLVLAGVGVPGGATVVNFSGTAIPEPGSMAVLSGLGMVFGFGAWRRRRQASLETAT